MGRTVTVKSNSNQKARVRPSLFTRPTPFVIAFVLILGLCILSLQAIMAFASHEPPLRHSITIHYVLPVAAAGQSNEVTKTFHVRDGTLFTYTPESGQSHILFAGWYTCDSDNPDPETRFDTSRPITKDLVLFGWFSG